jgi:peptide/nickel transport system permease protein
MEPSWAHVWGTDDLGRDVLSRVLHGFSTTVRVSINALVSSLGIGILLGGLAGFYYDTWADRVFNWVVNLILSLPFLLIMASILSLTRPTIEKAYVILTCIMWVNPARLVRAEVLKTKNLDYVVAAKALGAREWRILTKTILPGCVGSAVTFSVSYLPEIIALEAGLSFLGLGVQPPEPGLGKMIFDGLNFIYSAWWISFFPAGMLFLLVLAINLFLRFRRADHV